MMHVFYNNWYRVEILISGIQNNWILVRPEQLIEIVIIQITVMINNNWFVKAT